MSDGGPMIFVWSFRLLMVVFLCWSAAIALSKKPIEAERRKIAIQIFLAVWAGAVANELDPTELRELLLPK